jgi:glycosyltransferase involved in cell wall biosynthesis
VILQIGTAPHKNLANLARACAGLNVELRIIGEPDEESRNVLKQSGISHSSVTNLSDAEVRQEYDNADIVAFCSTFEGFGLPVIEAQAMRRPVITSNLSPLREVAGDGGALLVEPHDPASIRTAITKLIADPELARQLVSRGSENVKRFSPEQIALEYGALYDRMRSDAKL